MNSIKRVDNERQLYTRYRWVWDMISSPEEYESFSKYILLKIKEHETLKTSTLLHLGCGSGCIDYTLKNHYSITSVDLSEDMVKSAILKNPECEYLVGDMRTFNLNRKFDAIILPDSTAYLLTETEIYSIFKNAKNMLNKDGLLLVMVEYDPEYFPQNRTTVEKVRKDDIELTFIENNYAKDLKENSFEATFIFLIRKKGELDAVMDVHRAGLFKKEVWYNQMVKAGFKTELIEDEILGEIAQKGSFLLIGKI